MSEAATLEIIRDLFGIAGVALVIGLGVYAFIRAGGGPQWNCDGNVLARPYGWPDGIVALLLIAFFIINSTAGSSHPETTGVQGGETPATAMLVGMVFMLVIAMAILTFMRIRGQEPGEMFGIRQLPPLRAVLFGAGSLTLVYSIMFGVCFLVKEIVFHGNWPDNSLQEPVEIFQKSGGIFIKLMLGLAAVIVVPFAEETIFRGFFYGVTKRFSDRWFAAILTSLVFACVHSHVGSAIPLFILAMGFSITYEITGCLLVPIAMHSLFNAFNLALLTYVPQS